MSDKLTTKDFRVGDIVWFLKSTSSTNKSLQEIKITSVGRRWVRAGNYRFDPPNMRIDGGDYSSPGRIYIRPEDYHQHVERQRLWFLVCQSCRQHNVPDELSLFALKKVLELLGEDPDHG